MLATQRSACVSFANRLVCGDVETEAHSAVVAWSAVRWTFHRQRPADVLLARDVEPSSATDDRGHRELVEERQEV